MTDTARGLETGVRAASLVRRVRTPNDSDKVKPKA